MPDFSRQLGGSPTGVATTVSVGSEPLAILADGSARIRFDLYNAGALIYLGLPTVASGGFRVPSGVAISDSDWKGPVQAMSSAPTSIVFLRELLVRPP